MSSTLQVLFLSPHVSFVSSFLLLVLSLRKTLFFLFSPLLFYLCLTLALFFWFFSFLSAFDPCVWTSRVEETLSWTSRVELCVFDPRTNKKRKVRLTSSLLVLWLAGFEIWLWLAGFEIWLAEKCV